MGDPVHCCRWISLFKHNLSSSSRTISRALWSICNHGMMLVVTVNGLCYPRSSDHFPPWICKTMSSSCHHDRVSERVLREMVHRLVHPTKSCIWNNHARHTPRNAPEIRHIIGRQSIQHHRPTTHPPPTSSPIFPCHPRNHKCKQTASQPPAQTTPNLSQPHLTRP